MSENEKQNETDLVHSELLGELASDETLEITIKRDTNEVILRNPKDNKVVKLKANVEESIEEKHHHILDDDDDDEPLSLEDFEQGLRKLDALGLTFSADLSPSVISKNESSSELVDVEMFKELQDQYPNLPSEVGLIAHNALTGRTDGLDELGGLESYEKKAEIVKELIITDEYRGQFFFRHALKVPYFESIDWEVILKTHERNVKGNISIPYALLMLTFHNTNPRFGKLDLHQNVTVAVNRDLIDKLLGTLTEVRTALEESYKLRDVLRNKKSLTE